ncbi:MAG: hypothetical protein U0T11_00435 [Chitinophagaceae bacterium]
MYEHKRQKLASNKTFFRRQIGHVFFAGLIIVISLFIGIIGYHITDNIPWIDSLHNASMILSGMGPVVEIHSNAGKYFSSFYALFSGIVFITNIGIILAPAVHRIFHILHLEDNAT